MESKKNIKSNIRYRIENYSIIEYFIEFFGRIKWRENERFIFFLIIGGTIWIMEREQEICFYFLKIGLHAYIKSKILCVIILFV